MAKEHLYFIAGMVAVLLPLAAVYSVKKFHPFDERPDARIPYATVDGRSMDLHHFKAHGAGGPAPALLLFHGGRWLFGGPESLYPQCQYFARLGYQCFSARYRLGSRNQPDVRGAVADARAAMDYLQTHATELHLDPQRLFVGGSSSGGHLAAALGTGLPGGDGARPAALVLYNPMLDLSPGTPDGHLVADYWQEVSPHHHIDASLPPSLVLVGDEDPEVPLTTVDAFCSAAHAAGARCETAVYPGASHGFFHYGRGRNPLFEQTGERIGDFLDSL
ncbi:MAG: alpha/beta hydrolase [Pseudomonadota bacterium]